MLSPYPALARSYANISSSVVNGVDPEMERDTTSY